MGVGDPGTERTVSEKKLLTSRTAAGPAPAGANSMTSGKSPVAGVCP